MYSKEAVESQYKFNGQITRRKLLEYLPAMLITNLSTVLLVTVDGLVVGNLVNKDALSSVSIFTPATAFIGIISSLVAAGAAAVLSERMGKIDLPGLLKTRASLKLLLIIAAAFTAVIQIPIFMLIIASYHLSPEMSKMVWSYAVGMMIAMPLGLISTMGVQQLQIIGKMKILMGLAALEGGVNLLLDLLFVGPMKMGVAGAGYGTAAANLIRASATLAYLILKTDAFKSDGVKADLKEMKTILARGLPEAANSLMSAVQGYAIVGIVLSVFGEEGGAIRGVVMFGATLCWLFASSVQGAMLPLTGFLSGANALKGLRVVMKQGIVLSMTLTAALTVLIEFFPGVVYFIHGVKDLPAGSIASIRIAAISYMFIGLNTIFRLYFTNRKEWKFSTIMTIVGNATLPLFAFLFSKLFSAEWIWFAYTLSNLILLSANLIRYRMLQAADKITESESIDLYLSVTPEQAIDVSRSIRAFAEENKIDQKHAFRLALCVEEMAAYAKNTHKRTDVTIQIVVQFFKDSAQLMILDDGECIYLNKEAVEEKIITTNYGLLKKLSKSVEYQYILNLNYTVCRY